MVRTTVLVILISLAGIMSAEAMNQVNTLAANEAISNSLIESQVDEKSAGTLLETPYKGFYEVQSRIKNRRITFGKVVPEESFPDDRWGDMARDIASLIEMPAYSTGSRIEPKATAYVVFYDIDISGLDRSNVMLLPTTANRKPNTLAVLVIEHKNRSRTKDVLGVRLESADTNGNSIYFFELAM